MLQVEHGSLYPALHRLEDRGWISSFWGTSENNRRARYYRLTPAGRKQLDRADQPLGRDRPRGQPDSAAGVGQRGSDELFAILPPRHWDDERARELDAHLGDRDRRQHRARHDAGRDARLAARRKLGNATLVREEIYQMNTIRLLDSAWRDLRHGVRLLRLNPGFAVVAILSLALGVGANTAIFQLLDAVRLRTLPVAIHPQLVEVRIADAKGGRTGQFTGRRPMLTNPLLGAGRGTAAGVHRRLRVGHQQLQHDEPGRSAVRERPLGQRRFLHDARRDAARRAAAHAAPTIGAAARRPPPCSATASGSASSAAIPSAIGRSLMLDGHAYEIVGVTPPQFFGVEVGRTFDVAVPLCAEPLAAGRAAGSTSRTSGFSRCSAA